MAKKTVFLGMRLPEKKKVKFIEALRKDGRSVNEVFDAAVNKVIANEIVRNES